MEVVALSHLVLAFLLIFQFIPTALQHARSAEMMFAQQIAPFVWHDHDDGEASVTLYASEQYMKALFITRSEEGFWGSGYDWEALAQAVIQELAPDLEPSISYDPERNMFCAYAPDRAALRRFILVLKEACEDAALIQDIFSRVVPEEPIAPEDLQRILDQIISGDAP